MPSASELIAHDRTVEEVRDLIGADWLVYQDLDDLISCVNDVNEDINGWECSVFTGDYITGDVDEASWQSPGAVAGVSLHRCAGQ